MLTPQNEAAIKVVAEATGGNVNEFRLMVLMDKLTTRYPALGDPGYVAHMESIGKDVRPNCRKFGIPLSVVDPSLKGSEATA